MFRLVSSIRITLDIVKTLPFLLGEAINYMVSVPSLRGCHDACEADQRCCHYSYHTSQASHPAHDSCLLYSSEECDVTNLMLDDHDSHWKTGWMGRCHRQTYSRRPRSCLTCGHGLDWVNFGWICWWNVSTTKQRNSPKSDHELTREQVHVLMPQKLIWCMHATEADVFMPQKTTCQEDHDVDMMN